MRASRALLLLAMLATGGAAVAYRAMQSDPGPTVTAPDCNSCSVRKQDLGKLREALSSPTGEN